MSQLKSYNGWWIAFAIATCAIPVCIFLTAAGNITGEEFSPDDFTRRQFNYNKMPWFGLVIKGIEYEDTTPVFEQTLFIDGFIGNPNTNPNKTWHLIADDASNPESPDFDARFLTQYLDITDDKNQSIWFQWNEKHAELAIEFWPIIAALARENLYLDAADLLFKAVSLSPEDGQDFGSEMKKKAADALQRLADQAKSDNRSQDAVRIYSRMIEIQPTADIFRARAASNKILGNLEEYEQDLQSARKLK